MDRLARERAGCGVELPGNGGRSGAGAESAGGWRRVAGVDERRRNDRASDACRAVFEEIADESGPAVGAERLNRRRVAIQGHGGVPVPRVRETSAGRPAAGGDRPGIELSRSRNNGSQGARSHLARAGIARAIDGAKSARTRSPDRARRRCSRGQTAGRASAGISRSGVCRSCCAEWLEIEKSRPAFAVAGIEAERDVAIGGVASESARRSRGRACPTAARSFSITRPAS